MPHRPERRRRDGTVATRASARSPSSPSAAAAAAAAASPSSLSSAVDRASTGAAATAVAAGSPTGTAAARTAAARTTAVAAMDTPTRTKTGTDALLSLANAAAPRPTLASQHAAAETTEGRNPSPSPGAAPRRHVRTDADSLHRALQDSDSVPAADTGTDAGPETTTTATATATATTVRRLRLSHGAPPSPSAGLSVAAPHETTDVVGPPRLSIYGASAELTTSPISVRHNRTSRTHSHRRQQQQDNKEEEKKEDDDQRVVPPASAPRIPSLEPSEAKDARPAVPDTSRKRPIDDTLDSDTDTEAESIQESTDANADADTLVNVQRGEIVLLEGLPKSVETDSRLSARSNAPPSDSEARTSPERTSASPAAADASDSASNASGAHRDVPSRFLSRNAPLATATVAVADDNAHLRETPPPPAIRRMTQPTHLHYVPNWHDHRLSYPAHPNATPHAYYGRVASQLHYVRPVAPAPRPSLAGQKRTSPSPRQDARIADGHTATAAAKKPRVVSDNTHPVAPSNDSDAARNVRSNPTSRRSATYSPISVSSDHAGSTPVKSLSVKETDTVVAEPPAVHLYSTGHPHHPRYQLRYTASVATPPPPTMHQLRPHEHTIGTHHVHQHPHASRIATLPPLPSPHTAPIPTHAAHAPPYLYAYPYAGTVPAYRSVPYGQIHHYAPHQHPAHVPVSHTYYTPSPAAVAASATPSPAVASMPAVATPSPSKPSTLKRTSSGTSRASTNKPPDTAATASDTVLSSSSSSSPSSSPSVVTASDVADATTLQNFASVSEWQRVAAERGGKAPSTNRCVPLKEPIPSKYWGEAEKTKDIVLPDFHQLVNFPDYLTKPRNSTRQSGRAKHEKIETPDGKKHCVMCGKLRICSAASLVHKNAAQKDRLQGTTSSGKDEADCSGHIIPRQNKGLCTSCDVTVWVITEHGLEIKWCKGCKNFRPWAAFGEKGSATKCVRCRQRQREKYAMQKGGGRTRRYTQSGGNAAAAAASTKKSTSADAKSKAAMDDHLAAVTGLRNLRKATAA